MFNTEAHLVDIALLDCCQPEYLAFDIQARSAKAPTSADRLKSRNEYEVIMAKRLRMLNTFTE